MFVSGPGAVISNPFSSEFCATLSGALKPFNGENVMVELQGKQVSCSGYYRRHVLRKKCGDSDWRQRLIFFPTQIQSSEGVGLQVRSRNSDRLKRRSVKGSDSIDARSGCIHPTENGPTENGVSGITIEYSEELVEIQNEEPTVAGCSNSPSERAKTTEGKQGSVWGATALITGTSVGAGILALPAKTGSAGFVPSAAVLGLCWGLLVLEALLLAKVNVVLMDRLRKPGQLDVEVVSLQTMAKETLGTWGGNLSAATYVFLSYTLFVAYIVKAEDVMSSLLLMPTETAAVLFTLGLGSLLFFGGPQIADSSNQFLTFGLVASFLVLVVGGASMGDWTKLERMNWMEAPETIPVVFLSLVYHDLIPVLCSYLGGDMKRIQISLILGSTVPLVMLLCWNGVALGLTTDLGIGDPLEVLIRSGDAGPSSLLVEVFALLAVATSFIGTYLGMFEYYLEQLEKFKNRQPRFSPSFRAVTRSKNADLGARLRLSNAWKGIKSIRLVSFALVLAPPLAISLVAPTSAFLSATDLAGAYGMTTLYGLFPPLMAWGLANKTGGNLSKGGKLGLAGLGTFAAGLILLQVVTDWTSLSGENSPKIILTAGVEFDGPYLSCRYDPISFSDLAKL